MPRLLAYLGLLAVLGVSASASIIDPTNRIAWVPGVTVGVRGGIPAPRTNLVSITSFGANTTTNDNSAMILAAYNSLTAGQVLWIPNGTYYFASPLYFQSKSGITIRGDTNSLLVCIQQSGGSAVVVGPSGGLQESQAKHFFGTNALMKGGYQLQVTNTFDATQGASIQAGELYTLSTLNGNDPNFRVISVYGYERIVSQTVLITNISGNTVSFTPPAVWYFTNAPMLRQQSIGSAGSGIGLEGLTVTLTNNGNVASSGVADIVLMQNCVDSWITNCTFDHANNYHLHLAGNAHITVDGNTVQHVLSTGTSHSGILPEGCSGLLLQNNIFNDCDFALQFWGAPNVGCVVFANFWTNSVNQPIIFHNAHHMMNLFEQNSVDDAWEVDGYYGSNSHETILRNRFGGSMKWKRFSPYLFAVGNVLGRTNIAFAYDSTVSPSFSPWPIFELGYPNIGNQNYSNTSPPLNWNFPQANFFGNHGSGIYWGRWYTNCSYTFTSTLVSVTNLVGNFTNWPYDQFGGYNLIFQDNVNTNLYHHLSDADTIANQTLAAYSPPTSTNMVLNHPMTISNGWTMYVGSADTYQQLQSVDLASDIRTGNLCYTNAAGAVVWDTNGTQQIDVSFFYTNGAPSWWGTNRWPAIDPTNTTPVAPIPAQLRYAGISSGTQDPSISVQPQNQTVTAPATATFSVTASGGSTLSYQWNWYGTNVTGATSASWTTPATVAANNGSTVYVTVTDTSGSLQSANATLFVSSGASPASSQTVLGWGKYGWMRVGN